MAESEVSFASPEWVPSSPPWGARRLASVALAGVAILAVVGAGLWLAFRPSDARLFESVWELEAAAIDGSPVSIETNDASVTWRFNRVCESGPYTGPGCQPRSWLAVRGGCGTIATSVVYEGSTVRWNGDARGIAPGCVGEIVGAVIAVGGSGSFDFAFDGDRLVATAPDDSGELVFRPIAKVGWGD